MFPQSELDNYKLQVELLQEKLQRSEISRQQLEHKLDKILQKRDEHDKTVRSKARQKYQTFLEEQQRRNERNKQLVQMLERIEQQTEAMNARSERLKMMKLQYEMYFAKLVHSQTRRCIQNSVTLHLPMMATTSEQSMPVPTVQPTVREDTLPLSLSTTYQSYATPTPTAGEKEQLSQIENMPLSTMEIPTLANFVTAERNDYMDFKNLNTAPSIQHQQSYQYESNYKPISKNYIKQESSANSVDSPIYNSNMTPSSSVTNLSAKDKLLTEFKENPNLSTTTSSSTFKEIPNVNMRPQIPHNLREIPRTTATSPKTNNITNSNNTQLLNGNFQALQKSAQLANETTLASTHLINNNPTNKLNTVNDISQEVTKEIKSPDFNAVNEPKPQDIAAPNLTDKTSISLELTNSEIETLPSSYNTNFGNGESETNEPMNIANVALAPANTQSNSSTTPVSIENIENAIYGELLSPLETADVQNPDNSNVVPKLLENLVTQAENETILKQDSVVDNNLLNDTTTLAASRESENNPDTQNYEQNLAYNEYNNAQPTEDRANTVADYNNYENVDNTAIDESQQQQQYDYTNYDPTQYSYPGYIYDETTGEYKPDPNAPAEQYATDQQYTTENYDQQYQQQEIYDYNQTYEKDPTTSSVNEENTAYNNYETTQENSFNDVPADTNAVQQQPVTEPKPISAKSEIKPEEVPPPSAKVTKPTSILSTADKNEAQKKKKRVNFVDSSETDESAAADKGANTTAKAITGNTAASSESDFDFSSSTEAEAKAT